MRFSRFTTQCVATALALLCDSGGFTLAQNADYLSDPAADVSMTQHQQWGVMGAGHGSPLAHDCGSTVADRRAGL